jgi:hypothetical protein
MLRKIIAVAIGLAAWVVVATLLNLLMRATWPGYAAGEPAMAFDTGMLAARLGNGALSSFAAGVATAWIAKGSRMPVAALAILLALVFIPVHVNLWSRFPAWYHATFLASLVVLTLLGGRIMAKHMAKYRAAAPSA